MEGARYSHDLPAVCDDAWRLQIVLADAKNRRCGPKQALACLVMLLFAPLIVVAASAAILIAMGGWFRESDRSRWEKARTEMGQIHKVLGMYCTEHNGQMG